MSGMRYIENEGALFRGHARGYPEEVYSFRQRKWLPYTGSVPKGVEWGELITEADAKAWIAREAGLAAHSVLWGAEFDIRPIGD